MTEMDLVALRAVAEAATDPRLVGALRKVGHGKKRHPETTAFFEALADALPSLGPLLDDREEAWDDVQEADMAGWERGYEWARKDVALTLRSPYLVAAVTDALNGHLGWKALGMPGDEAKCCTPVLLDLVAQYLAVDTPTPVPHVPTPTQGEQP